MDGGDLITDHGILHKGSRPKATVVPDPAVTTEVRLGFDHDIAAELAGFAEGAACGIDEGHTLRHPVLAQPLLEHRFALSQLQAVVDAVHFVRIVDFEVHRLGHHGDRVGEIQLSLVVVGAQFGQHLRERTPFEAIDAGVGQWVLALLITAITVLNNALHLACSIDKDPAVTGWVLKAGCQQGHIGTA